MDGGTLNLVVPTTWSVQGKIGAWFAEATFDENIGREIFLIVQDQPDYAHAFAPLRSLTLRAAPGFVDTNHGTVAFIVWTIAVGTPSEQQIEQFLNPYLQQTMDYVSFLSEQSHVKVFILESVCNRVCNWFEFENGFNLDAFALTMSIIRDSAGPRRGRGAGDRRLELRSAG